MNAGKAGQQPLLSGYGLVTFAASIICDSLGRSFIHAVSRRARLYVQLCIGWGRRRPIWHDKVRRALREPIRYGNEIRHNGPATHVWLGSHSLETPISSTFFTVQISNIPQSIPHVYLIVTHQHRKHQKSKPLCNRINQKPSQRS